MCVALMHGALHVCKHLCEMVLVVMLVIITLSLLTSLTTVAHKGAMLHAKGRRTPSIQGRHAAQQAQMSPWQAAAT